MTRRERLERKVERREEWAEKRRQKSESSFAGVRRLADSIPLGQPILVGHHSEKRARRDQDRIHNGMSKGVEHADMAAHHTSKAGGLIDQLERSIYSDDEDAIQELQARIEEREAERAGKKAVNAAWRKAKKPRADDGAGWERVAEILGCKPDEDPARSGRLSMLHDFIDRAPYPPYSLSNLSGQIKTDRDRVKTIKSRNEKLRAAEAAGGVLVKILEPCEYSGTTYATVTFAERPERETIDELKDAGFHWYNPSWQGDAAKLPEALREIAVGPEVAL